ncbi:hypothetical protein Tco_0474599 [Tanacetum coccineum]
MSSASSAVTYTSVYTDSEPGRVFWGADDEEITDGGIPRVIVYGYDGLPMQPVAPPSPDYIPGPEDPQTPPVPQDEDEREAMFIQPHDPDYVPEPIYPEYIPLEDEHVFLVEEQPLPPIVSPTAESPGYVTESDPEEDPEEYKDDKTKDGPVDYPIDGGDDGDDDGPDSSGNGTEPVIPPPSTDITTTGARITIRLQASISLLPEAEVERLLAMTTVIPPPSTDITTTGGLDLLSDFRLPRSLHNQRQRWGRLLVSNPNPDTQDTSTQALIDAVIVALPSPPLPPLPPSLYIPPPVDRMDDVTESELPPRKRLCLSTLGSRYEIEESSTARPIGDLAEADPEIALMTVGEVNTRVIELAELHERDTHDLYALLEGS